VFLRRFDNRKVRARETRGPWMAGMESKIGAVRVHWARSCPPPTLYGGLAGEDCTASVFERAAFAVPRLEERVKSIAKLGGVTKGLMKSAHEVSMIQGFCGVGSDFQCHGGHLSKPPMDDLAVVVHAQVNSFYEFVKKKEHGRTFVCCTDEGGSGCEGAHLTTQG